MNRRTIQWLAGGLVMLVLLAVVGQRRTAPSAPPMDTVFLPGLTDSLDQVTTIAIVGGGNMPVATLDRGTGGWTVRERDGYRADLMKIRHTLLSFAEAEVLEAKTANPQLHAMLGVEDIGSADATGLAVMLEGLSPPVTVIVGEAAGDYRRYVRRDGESQSYLINRDPEIGTTASDWLDSAVIDLASARVRDVTVTHPDGEVVHVLKTSAEQPNFTVENVPEGRALLYDSVANVMASVLQSLTLEDVERVSGESGKETITKIMTFDGLVITVYGLQRGDGAWVRFTADSVATDSAADAEAADPAAEARSLNERLADWRYRIPAYKFEQLTRSMDDLLKAQP